MNYITQNIEGCNFNSEFIFTFILILYTFKFIYILGSVFELKLYC